MTDSTPATVAADYFDALSRGDVPAAMGLLSADVVWHQPGNHRFSGHHAGYCAQVGPVFRCVVSQCSGGR